MRLLMHYVYFLVDACGDICYVGRSINPMGRWRSHERKHAEEELQLLIGGVFEVLEEAQAEEIYQIYTAKPRLNKVLTSSPTQLGKTISDRHKAAIRAHNASTSKEARRAAGLKSWLYRPRDPGTGPMNGRHHSESTKEVLREANARQNAAGKNPFQGRHHTEETRARLREINLGKKHSEETKEKCRLAGMRRISKG